MKLTPIREIIDTTRSGKVYYLTEDKMAFLLPLNSDPSTMLVDKRIGIARIYLQVESFCSDAFVEDKKSYIYSCTTDSNNPLYEQACYEVEALKKVAGLVGSSRDCVMKLCSDQQAIRAGGSQVVDIYLSLMRNDGKVGRYNLLRYDTKKEDPRSFLKAVAAFVGFHNSIKPFM